MSKMVNLNKNASALIGEAPKVRVRANAGVLQIRPTDRKSATGLPQGEMLVELQKRADRGTLRFKLPNEIGDGVFAQAGDQFEMITAKHGWLTMAGVTVGERKVGVAAPAGGSVTAK